MTSGAAVIAVVLALMVGYYWARWRRAEGSAKSTKAMADGAGKAVWRARGSMLLVGVAVYVAVDLWFRGQGRLSGTRIFRHQVNARDQQGFPLRKYCEPVMPP